LISKRSVMYLSSSSVRSIGLMGLEWTSGKGVLYASCNVKENSLSRLSISFLSFLFFFCSFFFFGVLGI